LSKAITVVPKPKPKTIDWKGIPDYDLDVNPYKIPSGLIDRYTEQLKTVLEKNKSNK
tara:strand:- start:9861 stop:10031 length:171 start_codon:yes stop_codon:yes gene_type:complete